MRRHWILTPVFVVFPLIALSAYAQKTTEQFIPVGKSPGVSGISSYIGELQEVDPEKRTITVVGPEGERTIKTTDDTKIWLDRSLLRKANQPGRMADLQAGRRVEVKYVDAETRDTAEWIKIVVPANE